MYTIDVKEITKNKYKKMSDQEIANAVTTYLFKQHNDYYDPKFMLDNIKFKREQTRNIRSLATIIGFYMSLMVIICLIIAVQKDPIPLYLIATILTLPMGVGCAICVHDLQKLLRERQEWKFIKHL